MLAGVGGARDLKHHRFDGRTTKVRSRSAMEGR
jgi:hypothetical protein